MSGISTSQKYAILRIGPASDGGTGMSIDTFGDMSDLTRQAFRLMFVKSKTIEAEALLVQMRRDLDEEIESWLPDVKP